MIEHRHFYPPGLTVINNQKYIVPGWTPVPMDTDLSDIKHIKPIRKQLPITTHEVTGSKGDKYVVTFKEGNKPHCTCPGWKFRQRCKHITEINLKINTKKVGIVS